MARSVGVAARAVGLAEEDRARVDAALTLAMIPRTRLLGARHPAFLHPGRSVLILLHDVGPVDAQGLLVAALRDTVDGHLVASDREVDDFAPGLADVLAGLPVPGQERLLEALLMLPTPLGLGVLSERLDQLRHLHLRDETRPEWTPIFNEVQEVWHPFAARISERLGRRYAHWLRVFRRRMSRVASER